MWGRELGIKLPDVLQADAKSYEESHLGPYHSQLSRKGVLVPTGRLRVYWHDKPTQQLDIQSFETGQSGFKPGQL